MDKISDVQYVKNYDEQIGALYEEAKASYIDAPIQTLVSLRSIVHELCKQLHDEFSLKGGNDLSSMINLLRSQKVVNFDVIELLHTIKNAGNKAAHKYQFDISMEQYREMSADSVHNFCRLIEALNSAFRNDFSICFFDAQVTSFLERLSYKVIFDNDFEAKFKVGTALVEQGIISWNDLKSSGSSIISDDGKIGQGMKLIKEAADCRHPDAMYDYGVMLYKENDIEKAMEYLWSAADLQHNEAKAYWAGIVIENKITEDIPYALNFLQESAEALNPFALTQLSLIYAGGINVEIEVDVEKSNKLLEQAISQDYPAAFHILANKKQEYDIELSVELHKKSKRLGYCPASLSLARIYASSTDDRHQQAEHEYCHYLESCGNNLDYLNIKFEYAQFKFSSHGDGFQSLEEYLNQLVRIYHDEECSEVLATSIEEISLPLLKKFHSLLISNKSEEDIRVLVYFRPDGKLYKTQTEVSDNLVKIADDFSSITSYVYGTEALLAKHHIKQPKTLKRQESIKRKSDKAKVRKANKGKRK